MAGETIIVRQGLRGLPGQPGGKGEPGNDGPPGPSGPPLTPKTPVATAGDLPVTGNAPGDLRTVTATGHGYAWDGSAWVDLGQWRGNDSVAPGAVATSDGQMLANVGGTITAIAAPVVGQQLRKSRTGPIQWLRGPHVNLADVLDPLSADHSAALRTLIDTNGPGYTYRIPVGMTVTLPVKTTNAATPRLRNQVFIEGEGPGSVISVPGIGASTGTCLQLDWNDQIEDVNGAGLKNLTIQGDGPGAAQQWTNKQGNAIRILGFNKRQDHLVFRDVIFRDIDGFPLHADGDDPIRHTIIERCQFINCGNGLNYNAAFCVVRDCFFTNCEGIENSGAGNIFDGNVFVNVFAVAISAGGNQSSGANKRALPGTRIVNNQIFGVRGGTGYGTGLGIILAQSSPDQLIANNYLERTYQNGIQTTKDTSGNLGPDDGATILGNHLVNCGNSGAGGGLIAIVISAANNRLIGNRIYNRVANAADPYPLGAYRSGYGIQLNGCANAFLSGNDVDMSNGGQYALDCSGSTGTRLGVNRLIGGSTPPVQVRAGATFDNAALLAQEAYSGNNFANPLRMTGRLFTLAAPGINRSSTLVSAVGMAGFSQTYINTDAAFTWTLTPNGTEKINNVNAAKVLGPGYSSITLTSDGTNWLMTNVVGTVS